jgi:hypothetical protein
MDTTRNLNLKVNLEKKQKSYYGWLQQVYKILE